MWKPRRLTTLWASTAYNRDSFTRYTNCCTPLRCPLPPELTCQVMFLWQVWVREEGCAKAAGTERRAKGNVAQSGPRVAGGMWRPAVARRRDRATRGKVRGTQQQLRTARSVWVCVCVCMCLPVQCFGTRPPLCLTWFLLSHQLMKIFWHVTPYSLIYR
jgi:hypothetical protein